MTSVRLKLGFHVRVVRVRDAQTFTRCVVRGKSLTVRVLNSRRTHCALRNARYAHMGAVHWPTIVPNFTRHAVRITHHALRAHGILA